jgi:hypothetical protein
MDLMQLLRIFLGSQKQIITFSMSLVHLPMGQSILEVKGIIILEDVLVKSL